MTTQTRESKLILWVLLPVFLSLLVSAFVGLQLFQDGSSYLLEMLISHSAIRHGRLSILLFQSPTIFLIKAFHRLEIDPLVTLPFVRLAFNLNYATHAICFIIPFMDGVAQKEKRTLYLGGIDYSVCQPGKFFMGIGAFDFRTACVSLAPGVAPEPKK